MPEYGTIKRLIALSFQKHSVLLFLANLSNKEEIPLDANDIDHKIYGSEIRQATMLHENIRLTHGK